MASNQPESDGVTGVEVEDELRAPKASGLRLAWVALAVLAASIGFFLLT